MNSYFWNFLWQIFYSNRYPSSSTTNSEQIMYQPVATSHKKKSSKCSYSRCPQPRRCFGLATANGIVASLCSTHLYQNSSKSGRYILLNGGEMEYLSRLNPQVRVEGSEAYFAYCFSQQQSLSYFFQSPPLFSQRIIKENESGSTTTRIWARRSQEGMCFTT